MTINEITIQDILARKVFKCLDEDSEELTVFSNHNEKLKENTGSYFITGEIKLKNGTTYPAIFDISSDDCGEMFGYYIFCDNEIISHNGNLESILGKNRNEIFPFHYHLNRQVENDIHGAAQY